MGDNETTHNRPERCGAFMTMDTEPSEIDVPLENDDAKETATIVIPIVEQVVRHYYHQYKNYTYIYSGLQFGCHLVLYTKHPDQVHSDYAIYILPTSYV
jgi:tRNA splicing endonuclease